MYASYWLTVLVPTTSRGISSGFNCQETKDCFSSQTYQVRASQVALVVKTKQNKTKTYHPMQETLEMQVWSLGWEGPLEEGMKNHSSTCAWRIPHTQELGGLWSIESQRVTKSHKESQRVTKSWTQQKRLSTHTPIRGKWHFVGNVTLHLSILSMN